jgi:uncharacterized protein (DUF983 family)
MTERNTDDPERTRRVLPAIARGFRLACPKCGRGRLLSGYLTPVAACNVCGEQLAAYQSADFAPYLVTFAIGLVFTPLIVVLELSGYANDWSVAGIAALALVSALLLLPRAKGAAISLLWALDVRSN